MAKYKSFIEGLEAGTKIGNRLRKATAGANGYLGQMSPRARSFARKVGRPVTGTASMVGRGLSRVGSNRSALLAVGLGAGAMGFGSSVAPAVKDATLEAAFGDPNADVAFTGRDLNARFLAGAAMGGIGGGLLQASSPEDFISTNPAAAIGTAAIGTLGGAAVGSAGIGSLGYIATGRGLKGAIAGGIIGAGLGAASTARNYVSNNSQFFRQSPYSTSAQAASLLNASGDIVLGMHNSRRGY